MPMATSQQSAARNALAGPRAGPFHRPASFGDFVDDSAVLKDAGYEASPGVSFSYRKWFLVVSFFLDRVAHRRRG
jgi:hypothetical protein